MSREIFDDEMEMMRQWQVFCMWSISAAGETLAGCCAQWYGHC